MGRNHLGSGSKLDSLRAVVAMMEQSQYVSSRDVHETSSHKTKIIIIIIIIIRFVKRQNVKRLPWR